MVSPARTVKPGYLVTYPNRAKRSSQVTRTLVARALAIAQALLIATSVYGFHQAWNIEYAVPAPLSCRSCG